MVWKNKFHERINELWKRAKGQNHKMTQVEYAKRLGVTRNKLVGWLRGSGQPDTDGLVRIASTENVSLAWLLGDERHEDKDEQVMLQLFKSCSSEYRSHLLYLAEKFKQDS
ncbi:MAG: helix-turn-helix transcriptional regulator [Selenomonas sp.]|nr:helix-turn-helix transcriptional regulator [Selenomonas sp.]